jgi:hypothetical protein
VSREGSGGDPSSGSLLQAARGCISELWCKSVGIPLIVQSDYVPSVLGILVALAGLGYVVGEFAPVLLPSSKPDR